MPSARRRLTTVLTAGAALAAALLPATTAAATPRPATDRGPASASDGAGKGPVGWDVYRRLDRFAEIPQGVQTKQFSSFDRAGGNGDFNRCLSTTPAGACVLAEATGAGEIDSIWSTRDGGNVSASGNLTVVLDGRTVIHAPFQDVVDGKLGAPFVYPVVANADQSSGGVYVIAPMTYRHSMLVTTDHDPNYYHVTYRTFADAKGVHTFDPADKATDVIAALKAAGTEDPKPAARHSSTRAKSFRLAPGASVQLASERGPGSVSALRIQLPQLVAPPKPEYLTDDGRAFGAGGASEFTVKVDPANEGVRLTRRLDAGIGNQRAAVLVDGTQVGEWAPVPAVGGCRWLDQTILLPASATAGKSSITIRNEFTSSDLDVNEFLYTAQSVVGGQPGLTDTVDVGPSHTASEAAHQYSITNQTWQGQNAFCYPSDDGTNQDVLNAADVIQHARIRIVADGQETVDSPLGQFFGNGQSDADVRSLMTSMGEGRHDWFSAWWPMPYAHSLTVSLYNGSRQDITSGRSSVTAAADATVAARLHAGTIGYFRATANDADTTPQRDYRFLAATGHGKFVGVAHSMAGPSSRAYLEGDERVYVDGARTPQLHGTGTEDFYEGGWYFNRDTFTDPVNGEPSHQAAANGCPANTDCTATYRLLLADSVAFGSSIDFGIEHGPVDDVPAHYASTAFWYGQAADTTSITDTIDVGDAASERAHDYRTGGGPVSTLTSTYEGNNGAPEPMTDDLRAASGTVAFDVAVDRRNHGVVLRRTADQSAAGQRAAVLVDGRPVGTWLEPLGNDQHRWLDDTFLLPAAATSGHRTITVTLVPAAGAPAWTAARYVVQSLVPPFRDRRAPATVTGLQAEAGDSNAVTLTWRPADDNVGVDHYAVYAARTSPVGIGPDTLVGTTTGTAFVHAGLGLHETWHYRVVAVDGAGNASNPSAEVTATTGGTLRLEAEALLPATESTAPVEAQGNCCGISWSGGAQLWFRPAAAGNHVTVAFDVPTAGTYAVSSVQTQAPDYGITTLAIDGTTLGAPVDGYHANGVVVTPPADDGAVSLTAGHHQLTLTVTGKNAAAIGYLAGLDYVELRLTP